MAKKGSISETLYALYREMNWSFSSNDRELIKYHEFKDIVMFRLELYRTDRTCKEKWNNLIEFGFLTSINQYAYAADIHMIREKLGIEDRRSPVPETIAADEGETNHVS